MKHINSSPLFIRAKRRDDIYRSSVFNHSCYLWNYYILSTSRCLRLCSIKMLLISLLAKSQMMKKKYLITIPLLKWDWTVDHGPQGRPKEGVLRFNFHMFCRVLGIQQKYSIKGITETSKISKVFFEKKFWNTWSTW